MLSQMKLTIWSKGIFGHEMNKNACNNFIFYFSGIMEENVKIDIIEHLKGKKIRDRRKVNSFLNFLRP